MANYRPAKQGSKAVLWQLTARAESCKMSQVPDCSKCRLLVLLFSMSLFSFPSFCCSVYVQAHL